MAVLVRTITEAVRRIGAQPYDERDGRDERDQTITELTLAQGSAATLLETVKRSLRTLSEQLVPQCMIINVV